MFASEHRAVVQPSTTLTSITLALSTSSKKAAQYLTLTYVLVDHGVAAARACVETRMS